LAVYFLWHFPWGHPRRALPGTLFPWSPDFPPPHPFEYYGGGHPADWWEWVRRGARSGQARHLYCGENTPCDGLHSSGDFTMTTATMNAAETLRTLNRLKLLARVMDAGWSIPFTKIRFGADPILGLIPGGGDLVAMLISLYVVVKAYEMGVPNHLLLKMAGNIAIDAGLGAVPVLGDIFDVFFKSNIRNTDLLHDFLMKNGKI
jgi:hypothetical protein